jgi:hypothetical protein
VTVDGAGAETIDGSATYVITNTNQAIGVRSNGSNWFGVSKTNDAAPAYSHVFNATTDWGTASSGLYTIVIPAATHKIGLNVKSVSVFETVGGANVVAQFSTASIDTVTGDVSISVSDIPDGRFAGFVAISGAVSGSGSSFTGGDIVMNSTSSIYVGGAAVDGTWRIVRVGANLEVQQRVAGVYVQKGVFTP